MDNIEATCQESTVTEEDRIYDYLDIDYPDYEEMSIRDFIACVNNLIYTPNDGKAVLVRYNGPDIDETTVEVTNWWIFAQEGWSKNWSAIRWYNK